jgi:hypothetical protein
MVEGRASEAGQILDDLITRFPNEPEPHLVLTAIAVERGDDAIAADHAHRAVALAQSEPTRSSKRRGGCDGQNQPSPPVDRRSQGPCPASG